MTDDFLARLNRPQGRLFDRLRIELPLNAYPTCCFITAGTATLVAVVLRAATSSAELGLPDIGELSSLVVMLTVVAMIFAAPFVPFVTWLGRSLQIESALYYGTLGGLSATFIVIFSVFVIFATLRGPAYFGLVDLLPALAAGGGGTVWGLSWWYLHRRWKT